MRKYHVMVAIDFDQYSKQVLDKAIELAAERDALLTVIHVDYDLHKLYNGILEVDLDTIEREEHDTSIKMMKLLMDENPYPFYKHLLVSGYVDSTLLDVAEKHKPDLLVIGHKSSNVVYQLFLSPVKDVIKKMPCDLMLVKT